MSIIKRARKAASRAAHKVEHVAIKASTPGLSSKKQARLEHTVDVGHNLTSKAIRAGVKPTHGNVVALKAQSKVVTRNIMRSGERPLVYATGAVTALASYFFTPVAGAAVGAGLSSANYYAGATAARAKGKQGLAARREGRLERKKSINAALIGMSIGGAAAGIGAAVAGSSSAAGVGAGAASVVGPSAVGPITSIGGVALGAAGKIVPAVIAAENPKTAGATPGGITLGGIGAPSAPAPSGAAAASGFEAWKVAAAALVVGSVAYVAA